MLYVRAAFLASALIFGVASCGVRQPDDVLGVYRAPPPPRFEAAEARPGYVWENGHWSWSEGEWRWLGGRYEADRPGEVWEQGRWEKRGKSYWAYREGYWHAR